jgi:hypothetical protein
MDENVFRNSGRTRYPAVHGASGYSSCHVSEVLEPTKIPSPKGPLLERDFFGIWNPMVLPSLWLEWWGVVR